MEAVLRELNASDTMARLAAMERVTQLAECRTLLRDATTDMKLKIMSSCVNAVKDANPKIGVVALSCLDLLIKNYRDDFVPLANMSFELLLAKLGDSKTSVRDQAMGVAMHLVDVLGIALTFERLAANMSTKNQRLKESLLHLIAGMQTAYGPALRDAVSATAVCNTIAPALNDPQSATRQLAVSTLANLYPIYGEELTDSLGQCDVRAAQQKQLLEALYAQRLKHPAGVAHAAKAHGTGKAQTDEIDPWALLDGEHGRTQVPSAAPTHMTVSSLPATTKPALAKRSAASTLRTAAQTTAKPASTVAEILNFGASTGSFASSASNDSRSVADSAAGGPDAQHSKARSVFDPEGYMPFIQLKSGSRAMEIVDENDLRRLVAKIAAELAKKSDWEARTNALVALQRLAWGNLASFKCSVDVIKGMQELISTQIIDLRSAVSKEACRAVGALAFALRQQFAPLAELWWPHLARVVVVKIQVISSAADKCIRALIGCCADHRLLGLIAEPCTGKSAPLRKLCLEYLALACAAWRVELIEKHIAMVKQVVRVATGDADSGARKVARQLYWVLHNSPTLQSHMRGLYNDLDAPIQKHIQNEAALDNAELNDLLSIQQDPASLLKDVHVAAAAPEPAEAPAAAQVVAAPERVAPVRPAEVVSALSIAQTVAATVTVTAPVSVKSSAPADTEAPSGWEGLDEEEGLLGAAGSSKAPSTASLSSTAVKPSRRMSLGAGPVRVAQQQPQQAPSSSDMDVPESTTTKTFPFTMNAASTRRMSMTNFGRSLGRAEEAEDDVAPLSTAVPSFGASLGGGGNKVLDAKTPAPRTAFRASIIEAEDAVPPRSAVSSEREVPATPAFAAPGSVLLNRRSSGVFGLASTVGATTTPGMPVHATSALANGPKRIVRAAPATTAVPAAAPIPPAVAVPAAQQVETTKAATPPTPPPPAKARSILATQLDAYASSAEPAVEVKKTEPDSAVFVFSAERLRVMLEDAHWDVRVKALEAIISRLQRSVDAREAMESAALDSFLDLTLPLLGDAHHKVVGDSLQVLQICIASFPQQVHTRMGAITMALFHRLADRRQPIREAANGILNLLRTTIDPVLIMTALSPRMGEVPDRMKTALLQFMGAIAPHCAEYFGQSGHAKAFLSRMAHIVDGTGVKPSATLTAAARRLLELVFRTSPQMICAQIAALPFQHQVLLKKFLEASVPDIDSQVMAASKAEWASKSGAPPRSPVPASSDPLEESAARAFTDASVEESYSQIDASEQIEVVRPTATPVKVSTSADETTSPALTATNLAATPVTRQSPGALDVSEPAPQAVLEDLIIPPETPPSASTPATRLSSRQKLFRPQRQEPESPVPVAPLIPAVANPFASPEAETAETIAPRQRSPAAEDLEVRVLEYMEACRHTQSPSENVSPNSPDFTKKVPFGASQQATPSVKSSGAPGAVPSPQVVPTDAAVLSAVLASKRAMDIATEEIIQRYSPAKKSPGSSGSASATKNVDSASQALHNALMDVYGLTASEPSPSLTPARPSMLPQRSRPSTASKSTGQDEVKTTPRSGKKTSVEEYSSPAVASFAAVEERIASQEAMDAASTPASAETRTRSQKSTPGAKNTPTASPPTSAVKTSKPEITHRSPAQARAAEATVMAAAAPGKRRDTLWLLEHLKPSTSLPEREEASRELKHRIKAAEDVYWLQNYAQFATVLLESLRVPARSSGSAASDAPLAGYEHQEMSAKSLLLLARYRGNHLKNLTEVLTDKLCHAAATCPQPIVQSFEVVLSEFAKYDAPRLVRAMIPYAAFAAEESAVGGVLPSGESPQVRLLALRVMCNSIRFFSSAQLLQQLPSLVPVVLGSINSALADLRKAVVFILVEIYLGVGDSVFPHITSLTPPQRKLMTIYVEKKMNERKNILATALRN